MLVNVDGMREIVEFGSISEFTKYINTTPTNETFTGKTLSSMSTDRAGWYKTKSFEEATDLIKHGWSEMSDKLTQRLNAETKYEPGLVKKNILDVSGYQPVVPLYLMGVPTCMVAKRNVIQKQKVITLNKSVNYSANVSSDTVVDESIKALKIIKRLEAQNYRVNLNVVLGTVDDDKSYFIRVRVKSASERLNISKLSFVLVHPSMLRRFFFRFIETYPNVPRGFLFGYGRPASNSETKSAFDGYLLPPKMGNIDNIRDLKDLECL